MPTMMNVFKGMDRQLFSSRILVAALSTIATIIISKTLNTKIRVLGFREYSLVNPVIAWMYIIDKIQRLKPQKHICIVPFNASIFSVTA